MPGSCQRCFTCSGGCSLPVSLTIGSVVFICIWRIQFSLFFLPFLSLTLHLLSKVNFPSSSSQQSPLQNINTHQWRHVVRLMNPHFNPKRQNLMCLILHPSMASPPYTTLGEGLLFCFDTETPCSRHTHCALQAN